MLVRIGFAPDCRDSEGAAILFSVSVLEETTCDHAADQLVPMVMVVMVMMIMMMMMCDMFLFIVVAWRFP